MSPPILLLVVLGLPPGVTSLLTIFVDDYIVPILTVLRVAGGRMMN